MSSQNDEKNPQLQEDSGKFGLILVLLLVFGILLAGIILKLMESTPGAQ